MSDPSFLSLSSGFHLSLRKVFTEKKLLQIALANWSDSSVYQFWGAYERDFGKIMKKVLYIPKLCSGKSFPKTCKLAWEKEKAKSCKKKKNRSKRFQNSRLHVLRLTLRSKANICPTGISTQSAESLEKNKSEEDKLQK